MNNRMTSASYRFTYGKKYWTIIIVAMAILVKILMGIYTLRQGKKFDSTALLAAGKDALCDSAGSAATLAAALIYIKTCAAIEAYVGFFISILIIKNGVEILRETVSSLLGECVDVQLASAVKRSILSFPEVEGVFDLTIHNYGKEKIIGSAHIEVPDALTAMWIDNLQRAIAGKVYTDTGIEMLGITIYAVNSGDKEAIEMRETVRSVSMKCPEVPGIHGFYLNKVDKTISFEAETGFDIKDRNMVQNRLQKSVQDRYPEYKIDLKMRHRIEE